MARLSAVTMTAGPATSRISPLARANRGSLDGLYGTPRAGSLRVAAQPVAVAEYPAGATFGPRMNTGFEFVWVLQGGATWTCRQQSIELGPGEILLTRPGMCDFFEWHATSPSRHAYIHFQVEEGLDGLGVQASWPLVQRLVPGTPLEGLCRYLPALVASGAPDPTRITEPAVALMLTLFVLGPERRAESAQALPAPLVRAFEMVRRTWSESGPRLISLEELAAGAAVSREHLARLFRRRFGLGAVATLERLRLVRSAMLLLRTNMTVSEVATICGFASPYHFSRRFHRLYGTPPTRYRRLPCADPAAPLAGAGLYGVASLLWIEGD